MFCMEVKGSVTTRTRSGPTCSSVTCKPAALVWFGVSFPQSCRRVHRSVANDRYGLWKLGISHVVNAAHGKPCCQGCHGFYGSSVDYYGVPADDSPSFDLSPYFLPSADYIKKALDTDGGKRSALIQIVPFAPPESFFFLIFSPEQLGFLSTVPWA